MLLEFPAHADSIIRNDEFRHHLALCICASLRNSHRNTAACSGKLHCIAEDIEDNLLQPHLITQDIRMSDGKLRGKTDALFIHFFLHHDFQKLGQLRNRKSLHTDLAFFLPELGNIQDIIYET